MDGYNTKELRRLNSLAGSQTEMTVAFGRPLTMRKLLILTGLPLLALVVTPAAWGQGKKSNTTLLDTTAEDYKALAKMPGVTGKIMSLGPNAKSMTLRLEFQVPDPANAGVKQPNPKQPNYNPPKFNPPNNINKTQYSQWQLQKELQQIKNIKNPIQQQQKLMQFMNKLQNQQAQLQAQQMKWAQQQLQQLAKQQGNKPGQNQPNIKMITQAKEFQLPVTSGVHVAKKLLGTEFDAKGNLKEYTPEQLKQMQDPKYTGFYKAKVEEVTAGLTVYVQFGTLDPKEKPKGGPDVNDIIKGGAPTPEGNSNAPAVQAILILSEPGIGNLPPLPGKKQKN
jgi:hypothetical protein